MAPDIPRVTCEEGLDKSICSEKKPLQELLASPSALVHPIVKEAPPRVIVEAAYHGCPVIADRASESRHAGRRRPKHSLWTMSPGSRRAIE
jgi:glycosyltransferase involved in cell wall biosynthesis